MARHRASTTFLLADEQSPGDLLGEFLSHRALCSSSPWWIGTRSCQTLGWTVLAPPLWPWPAWRSATGGRAPTHQCPPAATRWVTRATLGFLLSLFSELGSPHMALDDQTEACLEGDTDWRTDSEGRTWYKYIHGRTAVLSFCILWRVSEYICREMMSKEQIAALYFIVCIEQEIDLFSDSPE